MVGLDRKAGLDPPYKNQLRDEPHNFCALWWGSTAKPVSTHTTKLRQTQG